MAYKLIAFDMDGTLLDDDKRVPARNLKALWAAAERGCHIVPATGRMVGALPEELSDERIRYYILINGAMVYDAREDRVLYEGNIPTQEALALCGFLDTLPVFYDCYLENQGYMDGYMYDHLEPFFEKVPVMLGYVRSIRSRVDSLAAFIRKKNAPVQKMQVYFRPEQEPLRQELLRELPRRFPSLCATTSLPNNIEINSLDADKGKGLAALCRALGLEASESMAFGDGSNDTAMLRTAGLGVAMANAEPEVKAAADALTLSNNEAGVGVFIEEQIAQGQL